VKPFSDNKLNKLEILNEVVILVMGYLYIVFILDDSKIGQESKDISGWIFISLYGIVILYNLNQIFL
jgi:hypothetical protein